MPRPPRDKVNLLSYMCSKWMHFGWIAMGCDLVHLGVCQHCAASAVRWQSQHVVPFLLPPLLHIYKCLRSIWYQLSYSECWCKWPGFKGSTPTAQLNTTVNSAALNSSCKTANMINIYVGLEKASRIKKMMWQSCWHSQQGKHCQLKPVVLLKTKIMSII